MTALSFKGKEFVYNHHLAVPFRPLVPHPEKGIGPASLDGNLIIQGDNLHALKALLPYYAGKVDCIFIDPPYKEALNKSPRRRHLRFRAVCRVANARDSYGYRCALRLASHPEPQRLLTARLIQSFHNTGNEGWSYNDNVNAPMIREWLNNNPIGIEDGLRHDKWCAMMWPRLRLLYEILAENGSLWITLDDNEAHRAKLMLDEIFGESGFDANIIWQKKYTVAADHTGIAPMHDHLLVYSKSEWARNKLERAEGKDAAYRFEDEKGVFRVSDYTCNKNANERPNLYYSIMNPNTGEECWPNRTRVWAYGPEAHAENEANGFVWWGSDGKSRTPAFKRYRHLLKDGGKIVPGTLWDWEFAGHTGVSVFLWARRLNNFIPEPA